MRNTVLSCLSSDTVIWKSQSIQASEDAKKVVEEEKVFARAEIENARAAVQRVEQAFQEQQQIPRSAEMQVLQHVM